MRSPAVLESRPGAKAAADELALRVVDSRQSHAPPCPTDCSSVTLNRSLDRAIDVSTQDAALHVPAVRRPSSDEESRVLGVKWLNSTAPPTDPSRPTKGVNAPLTP